MDRPYSNKKISVDPSKSNKDKETRRRKGKAIAKLFAHTQNIILIEKLSMFSFVLMISCHSRIQKLVKDGAFYKKRFLPF